MSINADLRETVAGVYQPLVMPPFPAEALTATLDNLRNAYFWAMAIVELYGEGAPGAVQQASQQATARGDAAAMRGWENIQFALMDLWRWPFPGETLH